jgi:hypothetical protein
LLALSKTRGNVEVIKVAIKERNGTDLETKIIIKHKKRIKCWPQHMLQTYPI